jgi:MYXO-CTERM domain-containing protein
VWASTDSGATFATVGAPLDPAILPETIDVAPSDPQRLYISGTIKSRLADGGAYPTGVFLKSTDGGVTWTQSTLALTGTEIAPFIAAVDPADAQRFYVRVKGTQGTRVLVTTDGGATFNTVWQAQGELLGFALSDDGSKIYAGGTIDGMNVASKADMVFTKKAATQIQCLAVRGATLLACSNEASGFIVGSSTDDGATFAPLLHLSCVRGPLSCAASSPVTAVCGSQWPAQQAALGGPSATCSAPGTDAGPVADGGASRASPGSGSSSGCACTSETGARTSPLVGLVVAGLAVGLRRRRRR